MPEGVVKVGPKTNRQRASVGLDPDNIVGFLIVAGPKAKSLRGLGQSCEFHLAMFVQSHAVEQLFCLNCLAVDVQREDVVVPAIELDFVEFQDDFIDFRRHCKCLFNDRVFRIGTIECFAESSEESAQLL